MANVEGYKKSVKANVKSGLINVASGAKELYNAIPEGVKDWAGTTVAVTASACIYVVAVTKVAKLISK